MSNIMRKLQSRKLWAAAVGIATGLAMVFGLDENIISTVSGAIVAACSVISYIVTEGKVDAAAVKSAAQSVQAAARTLMPDGDISEDGDAE